ncbi:MAG: hypothetical protein Q8N98_00765, partial [bacterium]|nr:hypothetical protein [bacterium]
AHAISPASVPSQVAATYAASAPPPQAPVQQQPQQAPPRSPLGQMTRLSDFQPRKPAPTETSATISVPSELKEEPKEPVVLTGALLKSYWMEFAEQLKDDQPRLYSTLTTQIPDLSPDKKIVLNLNNPLQEKAIRSIQTELLQFLRARSGHGDLEMQTAVPEEHAEKKLYTQEEKYQHLQKKNPDLDLFRQSLNLELE